MVYAVAERMKARSRSLQIRQEPFVLLGGAEGELRGCTKLGMFTFLIMCLSVGDSTPLRDIH